MAATVGLWTFTVYLLTLSPTVATNDAGRFQIAAPLLGTGHPTGYPTFILLGKLFTYLPFGDSAYRMNLMAAVFGAVAVVMFFLVALEVGSWILPAAGAALFLAFSATFWSQATLAEVYTMHAAFLLGVAYLLLRWRRLGGGWRLLAAALLYGISLGNNAGMVLMVPAYMVLLVNGRARELTPGVVAASGGLFLLGLSVYAYVPIRGFAGAWHNYGDPINDWQDVWNLVSGARFQGLMGTSPPELLGAAVNFLRGFSLQAPHPYGYVAGLTLFAGGFYGVWAMLRWDRVAGISLLLGITGTLLYAMSYRIEDIAVYYIPVYLFIALFFAVGVSRLAERVRHPAPVLVVPVALAALVLSTNYSAQDNSDYYAERERSETILKQLPEDAVLYGKVPIIPITYLKEVESERPDVTLRWLDGAVQRQYMASDVRSGRPVYFISDPRYNEKYLEGIESYAEHRREDGLIRLLPRG